MASTFGSLGQFGGNNLRSSPIRPLHLGTAGVHPLVKASMLPRIKAAKASGLAAQSNLMRGMARAATMRAPRAAVLTPKISGLRTTPPGKVGGKGQMDLAQRRSAVAYRGRAVPLSGKLRSGGI